MLDAEQLGSLVALGLLVACNTPEASPPPHESPAAPEERPSDTDEAAPPDPPEPPELAQDPAPEQSAPSPTPTAPCEVRVVSLQDANVYRGVPRTPALEASREQMSPADRQRARGRDHGVRYLSCDYVVEIDGRRYLHTYESGARPFDPPDAQECESDETKTAAIERLKRSTRDCSDLARGAYYGVTLEPMP